jgi:hypothetical protein
MNDPAVAQIFESLAEIHAAVGNALFEAQVIANLTQDIDTGDPGNGIGDGMQDDIRIAVTLQRRAVLEYDPSQDQILVLIFKVKSVTVLTDTDSHKKPPRYSSFVFISLSYQQSAY